MFKIYIPTILMGSKMDSTTLVTAGQKIRIRLPKAASSRFRLKTKEPLNVEMKETAALLSAELTKNY